MILHQRLHDYLMITIFNKSQFLFIEIIITMHINVFSKTKWHMFSLLAWKDRCVPCDAIHNESSSAKWSFPAWSQPHFFLFYHRKTSGIYLNLDLNIGVVFSIYRRNRKRIKDRINRKCVRARCPALASDKLYENSERETMRERAIEIKKDHFRASR